MKPIIFKFDDYSGNGGQAAFPPTVSANYTRMPHTKPPVPEKLSPPLEFRPKYQGWIISHDEEYIIKGVTPEMLDWFWANIEKCYFLWAPGDHNWMQWVKAPNQVGFVGSAAIGTQRFEPGGPVGGVLSTRMSMDAYPFTTCFEHAIVEHSDICSASEEGMELMTKAMYIASWEAIPEGCRWRCNVIIDPKELPKLAPIGEAALTGEAPKDPNESHGIYEVARFSQFLPDLYKIWKDVPDLSQNVPNDLRVTRRPNGEWTYVNPYKPNVHDAD